MKRFLCVRGPELDWFLGDSNHQTKQLGHLRSDHPNQKEYRPVQRKPFGGYKNQKVCKFRMIPSNPQKDSG
jgi:hypothetical protein